MTEDEQTQLTALWRAGLISYRRAFSSGRALLVKQGGRLRIEDADMAHLTDSQREAHEQALTEASQHIAHRVSEHEGVVAMLLLSNPTIERSIQGLALLSVRRMGALRPQALAFVDLCNAVAGPLIERLNQEGSEVLERAIATADVDDLYEQAEPSDL